MLQQRIVGKWYYKGNERVNELKCQREHVEL